jgi:hypothetical protein
VNLALVLSVAALSLSAIAASCAIACYFVSLAATKRVSTTSLRAELDEIRDGFEKNSALLKRINQRTVMQERRAAVGESSDSPEQRPGESSAAWKARMRAKLIVPGRPAPHAKG